MAPESLGAGKLLFRKGGGWVFREGFKNFAEQVAEPLGGTPKSRKAETLLDTISGDQTLVRRNFCEDGQC